ncbi:MAG: AAA family ATPase [Acetobacteraceae bacterium]|nr:AAA family ATPase [Acetobacteraceae bacterium]
MTAPCTPVPGAAGACRSCSRDAGGRAGRRAARAPGLTGVAPESQAATFALLQRLAGAPPVRTHISAVFIGADTVWKLRRAVRLAYVDFTTLAERERTARRELELNAAHAPGLYRDVVAVTRAADGTLALGGAGEAIDWVVRMARVPAGDFLDVVAARGGLDPGLLDGMADAVAALHAGNPVLARDQAAALRDVARGNALAARQAGLAEADVAGWSDGMAALLDRHADALRARGDAGFVRRCHGDLHLGNMCLWRGAPVAFDALEFDEDLATVDVGYDLAFLLMDLDARVGRGAANRVMNRYLARTGDWALVAFLPLFLSMRAMVRAHVEAARGRAADSGGYLTRALDYMRPAPACVVAIGGLPGAGKSTVARAVAPGLGVAPGAVILRSDEIRKRQGGVAPEQKLAQSAYAPDASAAVFAEIARAAGAIAAGGHAVVADATFMDPGHRAAIAAAAGGVPFRGVWLEVEMAELERRVAARAGDASDADLAVLRRAARAGAGAGDWLAVDGTDTAAAAAAITATLAIRP